MLVKAAEWHFVYHVPVEWTTFFGSSAIVSARFAGVTGSPQDGFG
jgi:hypothetical protein